MSRNQPQSTPEPPPGYETLRIAYDASGNTISVEEAKRDELAEIWWVARACLASYRTQQEAIDACEKHRNAILAEERAAVVRHLREAAMLGESPAISAALRLQADIIERGEHWEGTMEAKQPCP